MLEIVGKKYIFDHLKMAIKQDQLDFAYRVYITDNLRLIGEHTAHRGSPMYMKKRYFDIADGIRNPKPKDNRTAEDIKSSILRKLNGKEV